MQRVKMLMLGAGLMVAVGACSSPRAVTKITGNSSNIKFVYHQSKFLGSETGIVKCDLGQGNLLTNCRDVNLTFEK